MHFLRKSFQSDRSVAGFTQNFSEVPSFRMLHNFKGTTTWKNQPIQNQIWSSSFPEFFHLPICIIVAKTASEMHAAPGISQIVYDGLDGVGLDL